MNNKDWDKYHKDITMDLEADKDMIKFMKRFYRDEKEFKRILDIGCGQGSNLAYLSYTYDNFYCHGIDFSSVALCRLNHKLKKRNNILIRQSNAEKTEFKDNYFDFVVNILLFASNNPDKIIKEIHRILVPKGRIFIKELSDNKCNIDNKYIRRGNEFLKYSEDQLKKLLENNGFERIEISKSKIDHQNIEHIISIGRKG